MGKFALVALLAACLCLSLVAQPAEGVVNGSFELGSFLGWTPGVVGTPYIPWLIGTAGAGAGYGMMPVQPQNGMLAAWNGFDGAGPMSFSLYQDLRIPRCMANEPLLTWKDRVQWNFALTSNATLPRKYAVQLRPTTGPPVTIYSFSTGTSYIIGDTGWQTHTVNLSQFAGSTVRLWFEEGIPEAFTGPGQYELDAVSLPIAEYVSIDACCTSILDRPINALPGMTLQQYVTGLADRCTYEAKNHGSFTSCVTQGLNDLKGMTLTGQEKGQITSCAAQSSRGKKYR